MILNNTQAEAVYSAMCTLNNVGGEIDVRIEALSVRSLDNGMIVVNCSTTRRIEGYASQSDFAVAYSLN